MAVRTLRDLVSAARVVICAGSGGVGKTTTAAAIALWGAMVGRRTVVLTIDPARRLADSLGLRVLGGTPRRVPASLLAAHGLRPHGVLDAMMLDQKGAWDALIERHAPNAETRDRILRNRFYQNLSQAFAGSQEYVAIEQLCVLAEEGRYDLIVVDTPPTKHALDFLEAPQRMHDFLDRRVVRWFIRPYVAVGWSTVRTMNRTVRFLFSRLEEATGMSALMEISDFFTAMSGLFDGFAERIEKAQALLRGRQTAFILVAGPEEPVLSEAEFLVEKMESLGMPLRGVVFNRVHRPVRGLGRWDRSAAELAALLEKLLGRQDGTAARALAGNLIDYERVARGDLLRMEAFRSRLPKGLPLAAVPNFDRDLHDPGGLLRMHPYLFGRRPAA